MTAPASPGRGIFDIGNLFERPPSRSGEKNARSGEFALGLNFRAKSLFASKILFSLKQIFVLTTITHLTSGSILFRELDATVFATNALQLNAVREASLFQGRIVVREYGHAKGTICLYEYELDPATTLTHSGDPDSLQLLLVTKGNMTLDVLAGSPALELSPANCAVFKSGEYTISFPEKTPLQYLVVDTRALAVMMDWPDFTEGCYDRTLEMEALVQQLILPPLRHDAPADWLTLQLLHLLLELRVKIERGTGKDKKQSRYLSYVLAADAYIRTHLKERLTINDICIAVGLNECGLKEAFSQHFDYGMIGWQHKLRIEHAKYLLVFTRKTIPEISDECGYESVSTFRHNFLTATNLAPNKWRLKYST